MTKPAPLDLMTITLDSGNHSSRARGACLLEAVAWFAGEAHSDHPACTCPVLAAYGRALNDRLMDEERQLLRPLIPQLVGTYSTPAVEEARRKVLVQSVLEYFAARRDATGATLRKIGWEDLAARVEVVPAITDVDSAHHARQVMRAVSDEAWSRRNAAYAADADAAAAAAADAAAYAADAAAAAYAVVTYVACAAAAYAACAATAAYATSYSLSRDERLAARRPAVDAAIATFVRAIQTTEAV